jgi:membrane-bound metal-dependent hydrolase YbcI (DUF457 family)
MKNRPRLRNSAMPFTPYHFGPHALIALPLRKYIDFPIFMLTNIAIDLEPLAVILFSLNYPVHGYFHTFLIGGMVGVVWAIVAYPFRNFLKEIMNALRLSYDTTLLKMMISGILGAWLHVLFDAPIYADIRPFYPIQSNPLFGILSSQTVYTICSICFIPALLLYVLGVVAFLKKKKI